MWFMYINMYVNTIIKWYSSPEAIYIHPYMVMILFAVLLKFQSTIIVYCTVFKHLQIRWDTKTSE